MAASDRSIRASDADRERVAASLRDHYAAGRLTSDEFNERLDKAYAATTLGDLADLQTDLPAPEPAPLPAPAQPAGPVMRTSGRFSLEWRTAVGSWLSLTLICSVIAILTHSAWVLMPPGIFTAVLLGRWITGAPAPGSDRMARRQYRRDYHHRDYRRDYRRDRRGF
jgi:hypothetical protein